MLLPHHERLADILIHHSCQVQPGEKVLIEAFDLPETNLVRCLVEKILKAKAIPIANLKSNSVLSVIYESAGSDTFDFMKDNELALMKQMDAYIGIRGAVNAEEFSSVPASQWQLFQERLMKPVHLEQRVPHTKWVVLRYPTPSMAQSAKMSTQRFEEFFYDVCTVDYDAMARNLEPLAARMEAADRVRITAPGTDLTFSIAGIPVVPCYGRRNIPDGEIFTAPLRDSLKGVIQYNTPSRYQGTVFNEIRFEFESGKIVNASCQGDATKLNSILDSDEGARYIGEWSLGINYTIQQPMLDTLFDEKIGGSLHLTPGNAYDTADNGNRSGIHWDLVLIQNSEYGGGDVWFDDELIRRDGLFVPEDLQPLNPDRDPGS